VDWDGEIRMNPASPYAMAKVIEKRHHFDIAFACDTDHDRHGIVSPKAGLLSPNHYLCIAIDFLFQNRSAWSKEAGIGKTVVTTQMIDRLAKKLNRPVDEVPVGFKWFVDGLLDSTLSFCGEQSAGAAFSRFDGKVWTTDKDGIISALLSAEMTASLKTDISTLYQHFEDEFGKIYFQQRNSKATLLQKEKLSTLSAEQITFTQLAGDNIQKILTTAPGNNEPIGGVKVISSHGWFVARPSGTEAIIEICAESFRNAAHLEKILKEAEMIVAKTLSDKIADGEPHEPT
jgi:phosphoglucomutase